MEHLHDLGVGAAVERALQRADGPGDGAVCVRPAGGHGAAHEGGVVAAAVLRVDHEHHVQQMGLFFGIVGVRPDHPQEVLRRGQLRNGEVDVQGVPLEIVALHRVGVGHDGGEAADELHRLQQQIGDGGIVRVGVVGVQAQYAAGQLIHHILTGVTHDHALGEALRQLPCLTHDPVEPRQLILGGQEAHQQQVRHLLKAEGACLAVRLHDVVQLDAPVVQAAGGRHPLAVLQQVALHAAHLGDACQHAGAVAVSQTLLDLAVVELLSDGVFLLNTAAQRPCIAFQNTVVSFDHDAFLSPAPDAGLLSCCSDYSAVDSILQVKKQQIS